MLQSACKTISRLLAFVGIFAMLQCGNAAGTRVGNPPTESTTAAFPANFAVASPLNSTAVDTNSISSEFLVNGILYADAFDTELDEINSILNGTDCTFSIAKLTQQSADATCYGPEVIYQNHPNSPGGTQDGTLPTGDVGLWFPNDTNDDGTIACAAAQLNSKTNGIANQANTALKVFAAMNCLIQNDSTLDFPTTDGDSENLTAALDAALSSTDNATYNITSALLSLTQSSTTSDIEDINTTNTSFDLYTYEVTFTETADSSRTYRVSLDHIPLSSSGSLYLGRVTLSFPFDDTTQGNCPDSELLRAASITYYRNTLTELNFQANSAGYCNRTQNPFSDTGTLDPANTYVEDLTENGWGYDWETFTASFNTEDLTGGYVYLWQAGRNDSHARILNIDRSDELSATAYFGFGEDVPGGTSGLIDGMICNWAGPGNTHTPKELIQRQVMSRASTQDNFSADSSNITYAPTNSCNYDGTGTFTFDSDETEGVDTNPATSITNNLFDLNSVVFELPSQPFDYDSLDAPSE